MIGEGRNIITLALSNSEHLILYNSLKEKGQFGARNDAWVAVDDARGEVSYLLEFKNEKINTKDLKKYLVSASKAFTDYLSYDTPDLIKEAEILLLN